VIFFRGGFQVKCLTLLPIVCLAMLVLESSLHADIVTFVGSDGGAGSADPRPNSSAAASAFDSAVAAIGTITIIDFESAPLGSYSSLEVVPGVIMNAASVPSGFTFGVVDAPVGTPDRIWGYNTTAGGMQFASVPGNTSAPSIEFQFSQGINAFGAYISGLQGTVVGTQTVTFFDGSSQQIFIPQLSSGIAFVGFTDAGKEIAQVRIYVAGDTVGIDDIRFGRAAAIPEPGPLAVLGFVMAWSGVTRPGRRANSRNASAHGPGSILKTAANVALRRA
jgi:hypothetical protein